MRDESISIETAPGEGGPDLSSTGRRYDAAAAGEIVEGCCWEASFVLRENGLPDPARHLAVPLSDLRWKSPPIGERRPDDALCDAARIAAGRVLAARTTQDARKIRCACCGERIGGDMFVAFGESLACLSAMGKSGDPGVCGFAAVWRARQGLEIARRVVPSG